MIKSLLSKKKKKIIKLVYKNKFHIYTIYIATSLNCFGRVNNSRKLIIEFAVL